MKPWLLDAIICPTCGGMLSTQDSSFLCKSCDQSYPLHGRIPLFDQPPEGMQPSRKVERGRDLGTPWRRANWRFLEQQLARSEKDALCLDVGAGRGDFSSLFLGRRYLSLDVYPYPEVDLVCDLTRTVPLRNESFDIIALMNVMEHVYDTHALLAALSDLLQPGGFLIVAIPFLIKIHQAPIDYVRFTHFALRQLGEEHGLRVDSMEGFYDPISVLGEGIGNLKWSVVPSLPGARHYAARALLAGVEALSKALHSVLGGGNTQPPEEAKSMAPTGYQVVYQKKQGATTTA